ncbi:DUF2188 domain-containing protein [Mycoplasma todarodis]|uniref:DUF2188 domain-containing protein n=1 Tax=Mycoplasma todarodis TaxID=1937191 RepID=A0A4R0XSK9_9MOLU|nr:DUF2188 domain-containing protein [Mycoplasma todarodis]TCG10697.1 hypothetical protein C4B25_03235 [Mycoplasma todarodis]
MKRYVVNRKDGWALVNANYKRSIKKFNTQIEAIEHAYKMADTHALIIQGKDGKFRKMSEWDQTNTEIDIKERINDGKQQKDLFIPAYVSKNTNEETKKAIKMSKISTLLWALVLILVIGAIIFGVLYGIELRRFNNV